MGGYLQKLLLEWLAHHPGSSEAEFARRSGLTRAAVNKIKNEGKGAGEQTVEGFARGLGVPKLKLRQDAEIWHAEKNGLPPPQMVIDASTSQAQPRLPQARYLRGFDVAFERAKQRWGHVFSPEEFDKMASFGGLALPELLDDAVMFQLLSTARAALAAKRAGAIDPEQQKILDEMAQLEADADAEYEAKQKAKAAGAEGQTPKPASATRKKGDR